MTPMNDQVASSIECPKPGWFHAPTGNERTWIGLALAWCLVMSLMMPYWHFKGKQNTDGETYKVTPADFTQRTEKFILANTGEEVLLEDGFIPEVAAPPGDVYLIAHQFAWFPTLKLRAGETYRLHMSSVDYQHGFSLQPMNMNFQVVPGYDHVLTIKPQAPGEYPIVCNEFCGIGHQNMVGKIIVE
jgi:cytochrome c oxidase subunit II